MFRRCCGGKRTANKSGNGDDELKSAASPNLNKKDSSRNLFASVNDVRSHDNNTVLVQFQEDVKASSFEKINCGQVQNGMGLVWFCIICF